MDEEKPISQREQNVNQQGSMQESMQEASLSPELRNLSEAERSGNEMAKADALNSARNEVERKREMAKGELAAVQEDAERRGDPAPQLSVNLDMNTGSMDARDLAMAEQSISQAQQSINGAQGQKMLRDVGEAVGLLGGLKLAMEGASESNLSYLSYNANTPDKQKDNSLSAMLS
ncbi:MAG: hypothetical protein ACK502_08395 [Alphaproteobacteria bacterium]